MYKGTTDKVQPASTDTSEKELAMNDKPVDRELFTILINIQDKLNSPVFNGGFERLAASVEDIKLSQQKTEEHITDLDKRIYEPDEGLFSRIKLVEKQQEKDIQQLKAAQTQEIADLKNRVVALEKFQETVHKGLWYIIPACGVGIVKIAWDVISTHITIK